MNTNWARPWVHPDVWEKVSYPFLHADKIKTPTLFLCGESDFNVPLLNSEQMYQALRTLGVPTELVIYPEQFHDLKKPSYILDRSSVTLVGLRSISASIGKEPLIGRDSVELCGAALPVSQRGWRTLFASPGFRLTCDTQVLIS